MLCIYIKYIFDSPSTHVDNYIVIIIILQMQEMSVYVDCHMMRKFGCYTIILSELVISLKFADNIKYIKEVSS